MANILRKKTAEGNYSRSKNQSRNNKENTKGRNPGN